MPERRDPRIPTRWFSPGLALSFVRRDPPCPGRFMVRRPGAGWRGVSASSHPPWGVVATGQVRPKSNGPEPAGGRFLSSVAGGAHGGGPGATAKSPCPSPEARPPTAPDLKEW